MNINGILGRHGGGAKPNVKAGLDIDLKSVQKLDKELASVKKTVDKLAESIGKAADEAQRLSNNVNQTGQGTTSMSHPRLLESARFPCFSSTTPQVIIRAAIIR